MKKSPFSNSGVGCGMRKIGGVGGENEISFVRHDESYSQFLIVRDVRKVGGSRMFVIFPGRIAN